jgi:hypothetical protein
VESRHPRPGGRILSAAVLAAALLALLQGCASNESAAPRPELLSSGWSDPPAVAPGADFDAYVAEVTRELRVHRLPFDAAAADAELASVQGVRAELRRIWTLERDLLALVERMADAGLVVVR